MTCIGYPSCALVVALVLGCSDKCRLTSEQYETYLADACGCEANCIAAVAETPVEQPYFGYQVCVSKLQPEAEGVPKCCGSHFSSPLCLRPFLAECDGETVLERYEVDLGAKDQCAPVEFRLPTIEDDRTGGNPVLVVLSGLVYQRPVNYCAVLDLRRSVRKYEDTVTLHGNTLAPEPGFDPPRACPNAVEGPALNDTAPDGGM